MFAHLRKFVIAAGAAATIGTGALIPRPASADTTSTLLTAAAVIGGIVLYSNYEHKKAEANSIVGYTRNGGTVYADGRVVLPNGQTYYPNQNGQYANDQTGSRPYTQNGQWRQNDPNRWNGNDANANGNTNSYNTNRDNTSRDNNSNNNGNQNRRRDRDPNRDH